MTMHRLVLVIAASALLAGCGSFSGADFFTPAKPEGLLKLDSKPAGADATTSTGKSCKTPCAIKHPIGEGFSVTFTREKFQPETVAVQVLQIGPDVVVEEGAASPAFDPNPIFVELKPVKAKPVRSAKPRVRRAAPAEVAPAADPSNSPFPAPPPPSSAFPPPPR